MSKEIKAGDLVRLKSGGPLMTVENVGNYGMSTTVIKASCSWFNGNKKEKDLIAVDALVREEEK